MAQLRQQARRHLSDLPPAAGRSVERYGERMDIGGENTNGTKIGGTSIGGTNNGGIGNAAVGNAARATEFFARWSTSYEDLTASFRDVFAPHCVWDQRPMAKTTGPDAAIRFMDIARTTMSLATIDVEVVSIAAAGDKVHTERIDTLRRADGGIIVSAPVAGVLTFEGGRLVHWREYFDSATFAGLALGSNIKTAATSAAATVLQFATKVANRT